MNRKSFFALILALVMVILLFSGCQKQTEELTEDGRRIIKIATGSSNMTMDAIWDFNDTNTEYYVELVDYMELCDHDWAQVVQRLSTELATGKAPDIIDLSAFDINYESYAAKGVFEDLYTYIDADEELNRDDLNSAILSCCEYNGQLYGIMSGFSVKTMYATTDILEGQTSWTVEEFMPYLNQLGIASLDANEVISVDSLISQLCQTTFTTFVDYITGTASYDSQAFIDMLDALKKYKDREDPNHINLVARLDSVWDFMDNQLRRKVMGSDIKYMGFPTFDGKGSGNYINNTNDFFAINAASNKKDVCWELLRTMLTAEYQLEHFVGTRATAFPTNSKALNALAEQSIERLYNESGTEITSRGFFGMHIGATYEPATQEDIDQILGLIDSVEGIQVYDSVVGDIVREEVNSFMNGDQDAQQTAAVIQSRVGNYMSEQK